jgi:hypothetical protein
LLVIPATTRFTVRAVFDHPVHGRRTAMASHVAPVQPTVAPRPAAQQIVRNQAPQGLLQRRCQACAEADEKEAAGARRGGHSPDATTRGLFRQRIQPKLQIGEAGDVYEQEADRAAETIMRMSDRDRSVVSPSQPADRRLASEMVGAGQPLSESARGFFEPRFGHDFRHVRVHADARAAESARDIDALAYTVGQDIVFGAGQYAPESAGGRNLLAHELTHVVQQTAGAGGGETAQRKLVQQRVPSPALQARWTLDRVTPVYRVDANNHDENGETTLLHSVGGASGQVTGEANTWQTTGFVHQHVGGQAQLAQWVTSQFVFRNDGTSDDTLDLTAIGRLAGNAKAEDNHYARAGSIVWGHITQRTPANPTPSGRPLFEIHDGGISTGVVNDLGQIDADIPFGEGGNVHITIPLRYVSEGARVNFSESELRPQTVAGSISEVDVLLGARIEADADIETEFFGVAPWISRNYNVSRAMGAYELRWGNRPAPRAVTPPPGAEPGVGPAAAYRCDARCQENCNGEATRYLDGTSSQNCGVATRDAKSKAARGCYPRHCSCHDTDGFRGKGTQCENHRR